MDIERNAFRLVGFWVVLSYLAVFIDSGSWLTNFIVHFGLGPTLIFALLVYAYNERR